MESKEMKWVEYGSFKDRGLRSNMGVASSVRIMRVNKPSGVVLF